MANIERRHTCLFQLYLHGCYEVIAMVFLHCAFMLVLFVPLIGDPMQDPSSDRSKLFSV